MPASLCANPSCPNPASYRGRCQTHAQARNRETRSRNTKIYNSKRWQMTRRHKLIETPLCEHPDCQQLATDVHHKVDIQAGGNVWSLNNLEALCHPHHSQITRRSQVESS